MIDIKDWRDITYLIEGDIRQREVFAVLKKSRVLNLLSAFDPVLTGTFPIGIYLPQSDLDIICEYTRPEHFETVLNLSFSHLDEFEYVEKFIRGQKSIIARFVVFGFRFEIFGQQQPVEDQYAYRHMIKEYEILSARDKGFKKQLIALKEKGLSTEEAFASLLGIQGDPYDSLLRY